MKNDCYFCPNKRFDLNKSIGLLSEESIIYEDDNVYITPDISPLVIGHFLIISKKHINSFAGANDAIYKSLELAKDYLINHVFKDSNFIFFEHGAVIENTGGSSIDHAHFHGMPLPNEIDIDKYIKESGYIKSSKVSCNRKVLMTYYQAKQPYIYYEYSDLQGWIYPVELLPHQFLRMVMAHYFPNEFNWKINYKSKESQEAFNMTLKYALKSSLDGKEVK